MPAKKKRRYLTEAEAWRYVGARFVGASRQKGRGYLGICWEVDQLCLDARISEARSESMHTRLQDFRPRTAEGDTVRPYWWARPVEPGIFDLRPTDFLQHDRQLVCAFLAHFATIGEPLSNETT